MKFPYMLPVAPLCIALTGCATVMHGAPTSNVGVEVSSPVGLSGPIDARYEALNLNDRGMSASSNFQMMLDKRSDYRLTVMAPRYENYSMTIGRRITPWFWGNLGVAAAPYAALLVLAPLWFQPNTLAPFATLTASGLLTIPIGLVGLGVDIINNNMWEHDPNPTKVKLSPARNPN